MPLNHRPSRAVLVNNLSITFDAFDAAQAAGAEKKEQDDLALDAWYASQRAVQNNVFPASLVARRAALHTYLQQHELLYGGIVGGASHRQHTAAIWFLEANEGQFLYIHEVGWLSWTGKVWQKDPGAALVTQAMRAVFNMHATAAVNSGNNKDEILKTVSQCTSASGLKAVRELSQTLPGFVARFEELDNDPYLLNVDNGVLDLRTLTMLPHSPRHRMTKITKGSYDPSATSELWSKFLERVLPDELVRSYLQRYVGVSLYGNVTAELLPILHGASGRNGKSKFYEAVCHSLGDYAITPEPDLLMVRNNAHPAGEMDLRGTRLAVISESNAGQSLATATVKRLTGGDTIRARYMRQDFVEFTPSHNLMLITNHLPVVRSDDPAIWTRIRVIPFEVQIPEQEQDLKLGQKLRKEKDAILTWAVEGLHQFIAAGDDLMTPAIVTLATAGYESESDDLARWLDARCLVDVTPRTALREQATPLFQDWSAWCKGEGVDPGTQTSFGRRLNERGIVSQKKSGNVYRLGIQLMHVTENDGLGDIPFTTEEN